MGRRVARIAGQRRETPSRVTFRIMQLLTHSRGALALTLEAATQEPAEEVVLARAAARGDRAAFGKLVTRSQGAVFGLCYRLLGDRESAADAAQEAFVRGYAALATFDPAQKFDIWILRIARNHCFDILRHRTVAPAGDEGLAAELPDKAPTAEEHIAETEASRDLEGALAQLNERDREVIALYHMQNRPTREIAQILGTPPGTVMARLFRARAKLREMLQEQES
jgi:RNA polymerase sigma-70 factor, ECF subfamily